MSVRVGWAAVALVAVAVVAVGSSAAGSVPVEGGYLPFRFDFVVPSKLPRTKPKPVRMLISGKYGTGDGSHVPALDELKLELDRHLVLDVGGIPICHGGGREAGREVPGECEDAVVGRGSIEAELAFPETQLITVPGTLAIYNLGRRPGGADLIAWAYFRAPPITGGVAIYIKVRRTDQGRYGWKARFEIPKLAGGSGSITSYSMRFGKRIFSATCGNGELAARALSSFTEGERLGAAVFRTCTVAEPHVRQ